MSGECSLHEWNLRGTFKGLVRRNRLQRAEDFMTAVAEPEAVCDATSIEGDAIKRHLRRLSIAA